ncbi:hypothetical protein LCGC14_1160560 [marine sediment metagenome]|uniref:Uncharacterized protein n=1 Tax=marine sediment metagenome TaxID=412755 RepID=A0A0F9LSL5_9ZZZZ
MEYKLLDLTFTSDQLRAFSNALERAEIEVSEGDPLDGENVNAYLDNQQDVETAKKMWHQIQGVMYVR